MVAQNPRFFGNVQAPQAQPARQYTGYGRAWGNQQAQPGQPQQQQATDANGRPITPGLMALYHVGQNHVDQKTGVRGGYWMVGTGFDGKHKEKLMPTLDELVKRVLRAFKRNPYTWGTFGRRGEAALWGKLGDYTLVITASVGLGHLMGEDCRPTQEREEIEDSWFDSLIAAAEAAPAPEPKAKKAPKLVAKSAPVGPTQDDEDDEEEDTEEEKF